MSKKQEIDKLVKKASRQGLHITYLSGAGHWEVKNPITREVTTISSTPKTDRGVLDAQQKMKRVGFIVNREPRRKQRKPRTERKQEMVSIGDVVELKKVVSVGDVSRDIPLASYVVWQAIRNRMERADGDPQIWWGYQRTVINELWPNLGEDTLEKIVGYLRDSNNVVHTGSRAGSGEPRYMVSHEFMELDTKKPREIEVNMASTKEKIATVAAAAAHHPLLTAKGTPRLKAPSSKVRPEGTWAELKPDDEGFYRCRDFIGERGCRFATKRLSSFTSHQGKLKGQHVDVEGFDGQCKFCDDLYPDPRRLADHVSRYHNENNTRFCPKCWDYYEGSPYTHRKVKHVAIPAEGVKALAKSMPMPVDDVVFQEPVDTPVVGPYSDADARVTMETRKRLGDLTVEADRMDAHAALTIILQELIDLKGENGILSNENERLREENDRLLEQQAKFEKVAALISEIQR